MAFLSRKQKGDLGEDAALRALKKLGLKLLERNFTVAGGEIDLVMEYRGSLVFVEVKTRSSDQFGSPFDSITATKKRHLRHAAQVYMKVAKREDDDCSFCVVAVTINQDKIKSVEILFDAF